jgi:hypothetical protein
VCPAASSETVRRSSRRRTRSTDRELIGMADRDVGCGRTPHPLPRARSVAARPHADILAGRESCQTYKTQDPPPPKCPWCSRRPCDTECHGKNGRSEATPCLATAW